MVQKIRQAGPGLDPVRLDLPLESVVVQTVQRLDDEPVTTLEQGDASVAACEESTSGHVNERPRSPLRL